MALRSSRGECPEYRELKSGTFPDFESWDRICKLYGWPQTFVAKDRFLTERPPND
jgi:hypothetical protein